jgi:ATP-dependent exoDNAse (exonuclease V) alpha subunit
MEHGRFHLAESRFGAMDKLIEQWKADGGIHDPSKVFLLASLNVEVKQINLKAQAERILAGLVDAEQKIYANGVFFHVGDRLQFQQRNKPNKIENSDVGTVLAVDDVRQRVTVKLDKDDGREVTVDLKRYSPNNLRLGYASTTHKAQGATLEHVHVLVGGSLTDQHMAYVQLSRSVVSTHLFCDTHTAGNPRLSDLIRSMGQERQKTMARDIQKQAELVLPPRPESHSPRHSHTMKF